jgi:hypothetical protein
MKQQFSYAATKFNDPLLPGPSCCTQVWLGKRSERLLLYVPVQVKGPRTLMNGRSKLFAACRSLYHNSLLRLQERGGKVPPPDDSWVWWKPADVKGNPCKVCRQ